MMQLLPYVGIGLLLLAVLGLWARQSFGTRAGRADLVMRRQRAPGVDEAAPHRDLGERIFSLQDWDFVRSETTLEIQRIFQREGGVLAISWLRRTRRQVSRLMRAHAAG